MLTKTQTVTTLQSVSVLMGRKKANNLSMIRGKNGYLILSLIKKFLFYPNFSHQCVLFVKLEFQGPYGPLKNSSPCGGLACFAHKHSRFAQKQAGQCTQSVQCRNFVHGWKEGGGTLGLFNVDGRTLKHLFSPRVP